MYYKRKLESTILNYIDRPEIFAIIGPRQSGKTTLLRKMQSSLKNSIFLNFEDRMDLELFEKDIKGFAKKYLDNYKYVFIDEFQYSKSGGKNLKYLYDFYPKNKIIISGSSAIDLTIHAIKFLVGRIFVFNLYQLDFEEFLSFKHKDLLSVYLDYKKDIDLKSNKIKLPEISAILNKQFNKVLEGFLIWGGYPRVVLADSKEEKELVLKNIYNTYFLRDIKDTLGLIDDFKLASLIKAISVQIGQLVEYNELGQISGYDYMTLKKYLNILEKTFICMPVKPFFRNKRKEIVKNPKYYFYDTGMRNYIIGDFKGLPNRVDSGSLYENFIFNQLIKQEININFWRTKIGAEVDFIFEKDRVLLPIEIKSSLKKDTITKSLSSFIKQYENERALILNTNINKKVVKDNIEIYFLPHWVI
jgi:predicted AAA+ superfamily ATPase